MELEKKLRLNLQFFAEDHEEPKGDDNPQGGDGGAGDDPDKKDGKGQEEKTFTQEELDAIISDRLARERKKQDEKEQKLRDEAERKRLEEQGEFKELADKRQEEIDRLQALLDSQKADALKAKKEAALVSAGYSEEQVGLLTKLVEGETEEEIKASLDLLKTTVPPAKPYADPGVGNGQKQEPKKKDLQDKGKSAYQRLKEKGKIRRRK